MRSYRRDNQKENRLLTLWLSYTVLFLSLSYFVFRPFVWDNRSLIWDKDGLYQTFTTMVYYREYWREVLSTLIREGTLSLPMVDFRIGLGFDVMTTLNHYGFGDILLNISLFFEPEQMELCYGILVVLRYYLSGLTFLLYCHFMDRRGISTIAGAICYCFCGYALYAGVRHPYFLNSMIYFPLMLIGVEQILKGKKGLVLSLTIGLAASSNFYFMYMLTILTFLYALVRYIQMEKEQWRKKLFPTLIRGMAWYFLGLGLASLFLLPSILAYLNNARSTITTQFDQSMLFYEGWFYKELLQGFLFPTFGAYYWVVLSYPALVLFGLVVLFTHRKKEDGWARVLFVMLALLLLLPAGGLFMNGFGYVSHRWIYGFSFLMAYLMVCGLERIGRLKKTELWILWGVMIAVFVLSLITGKPSEGFGITSILFFATLILLLVGNFGGQKARLLVQTGAIFLVVASVFVNSRVLYSPEHLNYVSQFQPKGQALSILTDGKEKNVSGLSEDFYRITTDEGDKVNQSMIMGYHGTAGFFSIVSEDVYDYMKELEVDTSKFPNWFYGFGGRVALDTLGSVRYDVNSGENPKEIPFGYEAVGENVYENQYALPIGYVYDSVMGEKEFQSLSAVRKQQAMMQAVVIQGQEKSWGKEPVYGEVTIPYEISDYNNVEWDRNQGKLLVGAGGGTLTLSFQGRENSETYLRFENYNVNDSGYELVNVKVSDGSDYMRKFYEASTKSVWYGDFHHFIVSLGYSHEGDKQAVIHFPFEGEFVLEGLEVYSLPMEAYAEQAAYLKGRGLQEVTLTPNQMKGKIDTQTEGFLCFSIPFSKGFRAFVDGEEVTISKANLMYMAIPISSGDHEIVLKYQTPGLMVGGFVSFISVLVFLCHVLRQNKKNKAYMK